MNKSGTGDPARPLGEKPAMTTPVRAAALAGVLLAAGALAATPAFAQSAALAAALAAAPAADRVFDATTLNLAAYGETEVAPDEAILTLGVQSRAPTAGEAMTENAGQMSAVIAALRKAGVAERDIRTTNLNLSAQYSYPPDKPPMLDGYVVGNDVSVTVNDIAKVGAVVDAVTAAGANQINGVSFALKDPSAAEDAARLVALKALAAKAALYANASGYHIARLVNLSEQAGVAPGPVRPVMMLAKAATPVSAGELTVRVEVSGVYELVK
jgi:uncharacterized protein YggE